MIERVRKGTNVGLISFKLVPLRENINHKECFVVYYIEILHNIADSSKAWPAYAMTLASST